MKNKSIILLAVGLAIFGFISYKLVKQRGIRMQFSSTTNNDTNEKSIQ